MTMNATAAALPRSALSMILNVGREQLAPRAVPHPVLHGLTAWPVGNRVGESPVWDGASQCLLWIDVRAPAVLRLQPATGQLERWALPEVVGALGLASPGRVVLALRRRLALLDLSEARLSDVADVVMEPDHNRLNDGKVSPSGRWWVFGSMDDRAEDKQPTGALYRIGPDDASPLRLTDGLTVANGIAFSPDARRIYFSDSHAGRVWWAAWDEARGTMGEAQPLCAPGEGLGRPDGAAVDAEGRYWSAGVSAGCLNCFSPDGDLLLQMQLPCRAPTMPCFGGTGIDTVFVTSLVRSPWSPASNDDDGSLFSWNAANPGLPAARWECPGTPFEARSPSDI